MALVLFVFIGVKENIICRKNVNVGLGMVKDWVNRFFQKEAKSNAYLEKVGEVIYYMVCKNINGL